MYVIIAFQNFWMRFLCFTNVNIDINAYYLLNCYHNNIVSKFISWFCRIMSTGLWFRIPASSIGILSGLVNLSVASELDFLTLVCKLKSRPEFQ
jgi:hypothetical protein